MQDVSNAKEVKSPSLSVGSGLTDSERIGNLSDGCRRSTPTRFRQDSDAEQSPKEQGPWE